MTNKEYLDSLLTEVKKQTNMKWEIEEFVGPKNIFWKMLSFLYREDSDPRYVLTCEATYNEDIENTTDSEDDINIKELNSNYDRLMVPIDFSTADPFEREYTPKNHVRYEVIIAYLRGILDGIKSEASTIVYVEYKK